MRVHLNSKEKKQKGRLDLILMAVGAGAGLGCLLILSGIGVKAAVIFLIKNWVWAIALIGGFFLVRKFMKRGVRA